jgi:hypothetical protein
MRVLSPVDGESGRVGRGPEGGLKICEQMTLTNVTLY